MKNIEENPILSACPVLTTLEVIGGKWKPAILWQMESGTYRFGQLKRELNGITQKMLTQQLKELEENGIIWRKIYAEMPPRVEYGLTEYGKSLRPILNEMAKWGLVHRELIAMQEQGVTLTEEVCLNQLAAVEH
jgi:DNA-binding HxlR family transcriptional regulator